MVASGRPTLAAIEPLLREALAPFEGGQLAANGVGAAGAGDGKNDGVDDGGGSGGGNGSVGFRRVREQYKQYGHRRAAAFATAAAWEVHLRLCVRCADASAKPDELVRLLGRAVGALHQRSAPHQMLVAQWMCAALDAPTCLKLSPTVLAMPHTPLEVYDLLLTKQMPRRGASSRAAPPMPPPVRSLLEAALSEYGATAPGLWLMAVGWHAASADFAMAAAVHARALRTLAADLLDGFVEEAQALLRSA